MKIVADTREQSTYWTRDVIRRKLDAGDYSFEADGHAFDNECCIERKSPNDLVGTLGKGNARFKKELERAKSLKYFAIVVDCSFGKVYHKTYPNAFRSQIPGHVTISTAFTIHVKYGIPIFFTSGRIESKQIVKEIFNAYYKQWKLQKDEELLE